MLLRNRLAVAIVGHADTLPLCAEVTLSSSTDDAMGRSSRARHEAPNTIKALYNEV
jgi:hypothetical protein